MLNVLRDVATDVPIDNSIRLQLIGTLISAVVYGFVTSLFLHCLALLISNKRHSYTRTTRSVLIAYTVVMFSLSTASAIQSFVYITSAVFNGVDSLSQNVIKINEPIFLPPAVLGADGFLLWRCIVLYRNASWRIFVYIALISTSMGSLVFAVLYYLPPQVSESAFSFHSPLTSSVVTISIATCMNFIRASLITGRLLYHQETMRKIMGKQYGSPYSESCGPA
ncbi:hypothetical protein BJ912DRAFT_955641 [Pholiota molesta]|nr:hypothetical protein BJ912DRAFT_955641 [Pholiota molesta]